MGKPVLPKIMQWREIGEGGWKTTNTPEWFEYCKKSPIHDTREI